MVVYTKSITDQHYTHLRDIFMSSIPVDEFHAVEFYTSSGYKEINRYMMDIHSFETERAENSFNNIIRNIQNALSRNSCQETLPTLYRGTKQKHVKAFKEGEEITFDYFLSASTDPVVASSFAGNEEPAIMVIKNVNRDYAPISLVTQEKEVIISPSSRFTVDKITYGASFQPEYDNTGYYAPAVANVTIIEITMI